MNLITIRQLLAILFSILGSIFAFMNFVRKKNEKGEFKVTNAQKTVLAGILVIIIAFVGLSAYLEIVNRDQITADLQISVADPIVINKNGTQTDSFVEGADYLVVSSDRRFVIDATVTLENIDTWEKYTYHPVSANGAFSIASVKSGRYDIRISTGNHEIYRETIVLNRSNVLSPEGDDVWDFTAHIMDGFEAKAKGRRILIGNRQEDIEYPVFTIYTENGDSSLIFASEVDPQDGSLTGTFWMLPGRYELNNAVSGSNMETYTFDVD